MRAICVVLVTFLAVALARPQKGEEIAIVSQESNQEPDGSYKYSYETSNGIKADETGTLKKATKPDNTDAIVAAGSFTFTSPEGQQISVQYTADDENGFQAKGDHLPTPPPVPAAIQKAVEYLLSLPPDPKRQK